MFTGIVAAVGSIVSLESGLLTVRAPAGAWDDAFSIGESVCVNGCCLTLVEKSPDLKFELSEETVKRTTLGKLPPGSPVNLERGMRPTDRMGGHIVQGHVDGVGTLLNILPREGERVFRFASPDGFDRYLVDKGAIAVDGISLTVTRPSAGAFDTHIVPHTFENTNLKSLQVDAPVNMEFDILIKYVERLVR
jgi:riboflavin synthase